MSKTEGEFSGKGGMIQDGQEPGDYVHEMWKVYATDPDRTDSKGQPTAENVNNKSSSE